MGLGWTHNVVTSVASPGRPKNIRSVMGKIYADKPYTNVNNHYHFTTMIAHTFVKLDEIPSAWFPSRRSEAMATQSFPTMAITEPPLYSIIDCKMEVFSMRAEDGAQSILTMFGKCCGGVGGRDREGGMKETMEENA